MTVQHETLSISGQLNAFNNSADAIKKQIKAEGLVYSPWIRRDLTLIGFLPYSFHEMDVIINMPFIFTPFLLKYEHSDKPFLIYKAVECAKGISYPLRVGLDFISVFDGIPEYCLRGKNGKTQPLYGDFLNELIIKEKTKALKNFMNRFKEIEHGQYAYLGRDFEWELSRGNIQCICRDFLCLCSYMNEVTGNITYVLLPSTDVYKILEVDE